jgi:hypothetical protein
LDLGDPRRTARAIDLAETLGQRPTAALADACRDAAQLEAAYRFFDNACVTPDALLAAHRDATYTRLRAEPVVLALNDTTVLDYTSHPATIGLGPLRSRRQQGELVHGTLVVTPGGVALGLLRLEVWVRDADTYARLRDRHQRSLTEKESVVWVHSLEAAGAARQQCPGTQVISVGDREADIYDLFCAPRPDGVEVLVRARHDRAVAEGGRLRAAVAQQPLLTTTALALRARPGVAARTAQLEVRVAALTLQPPARRKQEALPPVPVWVVWVQEVDVPLGVTPLCWLLLTTVPTTTAAEALERVQWYRCRWEIELWHKILTTGCALEERQLQTQERLHRLLALYAIIAWRLLYATFLARVAPELPCTVLLSPAEWEALWCLHTQQPAPPATPPSLHTAVRWLAQLGGFRGRRGDGEPGMVVLWRGWQHLADATALYLVFRPSRAAPL